MWHENMHINCLVNVIQRSCHSDTRTPNVQVCTQFWHIPWSSWSHRGPYSLDGPGLKCPSLTNHWWEEPIIETCPDINGKIKWLEQKIRWKTKARQHIHHFAVPSGDPATHTEWHALVAISQSLSIAGLVPPQVKPAGKRTFAIWPQAAAYGAPWYPANICSQLRQPGFWQTGVDEVVSSSFASLPPQQFTFLIYAALCSFQGGRKNGHPPTHCHKVVQQLYGYGSIPIHTIFNGMNIHLPAILMFTRGTRFWHTAICVVKSSLKEEPLLWPVQDPDTIAPQCFDQGPPLSTSLASSKLRSGQHQTTRLQYNLSISKWICLKIIYPKCWCIKCIYIYKYIPYLSSQFLGY